jgi:nitroreductase
VDVEAAIRSRRTHKQFGREPLDEATVRDLLDLARFAPNHKLTQP